MKPIKEKKVTLLELFYDLIYVYAISQLTHLIHEPNAQGQIDFFQFYNFGIATLTIWEVWLFMTNYINRFGRESRLEFFSLFCIMLGALYLANSISSDWSSVYVSFDWAMIVMLLSVAFLYYQQSRKNETGQEISAYLAKVLVFVSCLFFIVIILPSDISMLVRNRIIILALFLAILLPLNPGIPFNVNLVSFPHLAERFELLTIITFGESIVVLTSYFDINHLSLIPVFLLGFIFLLFATYVGHNHHLMNHQQRRRGFILVYSHLFIVMAINMISIGIEFIENSAADRGFIVTVLYGASWYFTSPCSQMRHTSMLKSIFQPSSMLHLRLSTFFPPLRHFV